MAVPVFSPVEASSPDSEAGLLPRLDVREKVLRRGDPSSPDADAHTASRAQLATIGYLVLSAATVLFNAYVLKSFQFPIFLSAFGLTLTAVAAGFMAVMSTAEESRGQSAGRMSSVPTALLLALGIVSSNEALMRLPLPVVQMAKVIVPIITFLSSAALGGSTFNLRQHLPIALVVCAGAVTAVIGSGVAVSAVDAAFVLVAAVCEGMLLATLRKRMTDGPRPEGVLKCLHSAAVPGAALCIVAAVVVEGRAFMAYIDAINTPSLFISAQLAAGFNLATVFMVMLLLVLDFVAQTFVTQLATTSAITLSNLGTCKDVPLIFASAPVLGSTVTIVQCLGYGASLAILAVRALTTTVPRDRRTSRLSDVIANKFSRGASPPNTPSRRRRAAGTFMILATVVTVTTTFLLISSVTLTRPETPIPTYAEDVLDAALFTKPSGHRTLDLVVSHYNEDVSLLTQTLTYIINSPAIARLDLASHTTTHIYTKSATVDPLLHVLASGTAVTRIRQLPNLGREGATYLTHILDNYDALADWTLFTQAEPVFFNLLLQILDKNLESGTGFLALKFFDQCQCDGCFQYNLERIREVWAITRGELCPPEGFAATLNGQFLVSRKRIRQHPRRIYQYLLDVITSDEQHFVHNVEPVNDWMVDSPSNPLFGHVIERSWAMIFKCSDLSVWRSCMWNGTGDNCQCLDA
ncbi:hypothetical protein HK101_011444 [Irineochytrium annulatum]|nr:hypothetical protein HK101_011444 [Irineochytrium annulatum]